MDENEAFASERAAMVRTQIERRGIRDPRLLEVLRSVPRHLFVPDDQLPWAYSDGALRIEMGQTISQPYIVALMTDLLKLKGEERVLEVGTGSGYQAAVLSYLAAEVHTIERHAALAKTAEKALASLQRHNIAVHIGDGSLGLPEYAPYQGILITAAAPKAPASLLAQLAEGGRLVLPVGGKFSQMLEVWQRHGDRFDHTPVTAVAFVPLLGKEGWDEKKWEKFQLW